MHPPVSPARARTARLAVSALFLVNGAAGSSLLPRLPALRDGLGLSNAELGAALAAMPVGGLLAGGFAGIAIARLGSGRTAIAAGAAAAAMPVLVGLAPSWGLLAAVALVWGVFDTTMDAAMNAHGVGVERWYRRSILQGFHGMWSVGGMAGGAAGALAAAAGVPVPLQLAAASAVLVATVVLAARGFLPAALADRAGPAGVDGRAAHDVTPLPGPRRLAGVLVPVALLGILCILVQAAAATWSAVYLTDVLGAASGVAAAGYVVYMGTMVVGRMTNDRWIDRWGGVAIVRLGAVVSVAGVAAVIAAGPLDLLPLAFVGYAAIGAGTSPIFPVMTGVAGSRPGIPTGHGIALVSWLVRLGLMAAPASIGLAADAAGLGAALGIPLVAALVIALLAVPLTGGRAAARRAPVPGPAA